MDDTGTGGTANPTPSPADGMWVELEDGAGGGPAGADHAGGGEAGGTAAAGGCAPDGSVVSGSPARASGVVPGGDTLEGSKGFVIRSFGLVRTRRAWWALLPACSTRLQSGWWEDEVALTMVRREGFRGFIGRAGAVGAAQARVTACVTGFHSC
jgi:hypothetical protein